MKKGKWYYWDETGSYRHGPFDTKMLAEQDLEKYCHWLNTGEGYD